MAEISIAEAVLGITDPTDYEGSILAASRILRSDQVTTDTLARELRQSEFIYLEGDQPSHTKVVRAMTTHILHEILTEERTKSCTTLSSWPIYSGLMERYGRMPDNDSTALMIGSLTPISARAFPILAKDIYGVNRSVTVDIAATPDIRRHSQFVYGNGLQLPFQTNSIDIVHTNQLMHMLRDPKGANSSHKQQSYRLFREIGRVLKPGGQLFMQEYPPGIDSDLPISLQLAKTIAYKDYLDELLPTFGIKNVKTDPLVFPPTLDFLFDPSRTIPHAGQMLHQVGIALYGSKPASTEPIAMPGRRRAIALSGQMHSPK